MASPSLTHGFQYASAPHQAQTAIAGMWLFLASEVLLFGGLILSWIYARHFNPVGFDAGGRETALWIGTVNTVLLISSSFAYALGAAFIRMANVRGLIGCLALALVLAGAFLVPTAAPFGVTGDPGRGARLFFIFYFIATGLHGVHMLVGMGLVLWIIRRARRGHFSPDYNTPVEVVGLYWSFVDVVWLTLFPLIYLVGRS